MGDSLRQLRLCGLLLVALMAAGTLGFWATGPEHSPGEAFYLTLVVLTTVGMEAAEGPQRVVATGLMVGGIFTTLYAAGTLVAFVVEGEFTRILRERRLRQQIGRLNDHCIVVGFGRMGRALCEAFAEGGVPFVLIEKESHRIRTADEMGFLAVEGDAHEEEVYREAGIGTAKGLATCLPEDADNVFVTLTAREFRHDLVIISRAESVRTNAKLMRAGAHRVVCPPVLSAAKVMSIMLNQAVDAGTFGTTLDPGTPIEVFRVPMDDFPTLIGTPLGQNHIRTRTGMTVVAVDRGERRDLNPTALYAPRRGDVGLLVGPAAGLDEMRRLYGPGRVPTVA